jgi:hypothetical protein
LVNTVHLPRDPHLLESSSIGSGVGKCTLLVIGLAGGSLEEDSLRDVHNVLLAKPSGLMLSAHDPDVGPVVTHDAVVDVLPALVLVLPAHSEDVLAVLGRDHSRQHNDLVGGLCDETRQSRPALPRARALSLTIVRLEGHGLGDGGIERVDIDVAVVLLELLEQAPVGGGSDGHGGGVWL